MVWNLKQKQKNGKKGENVVYFPKTDFGYTVVSGTHQTFFVLRPFSNINFLLVEKSGSIFNTNIFNNVF